MQRKPSKPAESGCAKKSARPGGAGELNLGVVLSSKAGARRPVQLSMVKGQDPAGADAASDVDVFSLVYGQMRSLAGNVQDLDDLVQAALEQVYRSIARFEGRSRLSTWTYGVCYHTWLKHQRWHRRWFRRFAFAAEGQLPEETDRRLSAPEELERFELSRRLLTALSRVSPKRRAVVTLHDLEGLSVEAVAEVVGANPLTVRSRLRDGRRRLAEELSGDRYFDEAGSPEAAPLTATEVGS